MLRQVVMLCMIWYHLYNLKTVKNADREVLLLVKLQVLTCNSTKLTILRGYFFTFFKLYKWYQIMQKHLSVLTTMYELISAYF